MTTFRDGPARGQTLELKRAPVFLRAVVDSSGKWDALDQREDLPKAGEQIFVYVLASLPTRGFIRRTGGGGAVVFAEYKHVVLGSGDREFLRATEPWARWCTENQGFIPQEVRNHLLT